MDLTGNGCDSQRFSQHIPCGIRGLQLSSDAKANGVECQGYGESSAVGLSYCRERARLAGLSGDEFSCEGDGLVPQFKLPAYCE